MVQFDLLVGLWFEQIALPDLAASAFNGPGDFFVGDEKADLSLLRRNVAVEFRLLRAFPEQLASPYASRVSLATSPCARASPLSL